MLLFYERFCFIDFRRAKASHDSAAVDGNTDFSLAKTIQELEEKINASNEKAVEDLCSAEDFPGSGMVLVTEEAQTKKKYYKNLLKKKKCLICVCK